jgi:hypothetical protein
MKATLLLLVLLSCGSAPRRESPISLDYLRRKAGPHASPTVAFVADNQLHNVLGSPYFPQTDVADRFVRVAVRPVQLNLFGQDLFARAIAMVPAGVAIVHLGDGLDAACTGELTQFLEVLQRHRPWVMAPGNHDFNFMGNEHASGYVVKFKDAPSWCRSSARLNGTRIDDDQKVWIGEGGRHARSMAGAWCSACRGGGCPLSKTLYIRRYLEELARQADAGDATFGELRARLDEERSDTPSNEACRCRGRACTDETVTSASAIAANGDFRASSPGLLRRVRWRIDEGAPWKSFVLQQIALPLAGRDEGLAIFILDTNQYDARPTVVGPVFGNVNAGADGSLLDDQLKTLETWMAESGKAGAVPIVAMHHPLHAVRGASRERLLALLERFGVQVIYTAHTHGSFVKQWPASPDFMEINVGSVLDWTPEFNLSRLEWERGKLRITEKVVQFDDDVCASYQEWRPRGKDPDAHLFYRQNVLRSIWSAGSMIGSMRTTHRRLVAAQLASFARLLDTPGLETRESTLWPFGCTIDRCVAAKARATREDVLAGRADDALEIVEQLVRFERERATEAGGGRSELHQHYRYCQSVWASRAQGSK